MNSVKFVLKPAPGVIKIIVGLLPIALSSESKLESYRTQTGFVYINQSFIASKLKDFDQWDYLKVRLLVSLFSCIPPVLALI